MVDPGRLVLVVASGETAGTALDLDRELVLGRDEDAGLPLEDPKVSRRHARLRRGEDGSITVEDLGSTNGTFVNERRLAGPHVLAAGDRVRVGRTTLEVRREETGAEERGEPAPDRPSRSPSHQVGSPTALLERPLSEVPPPATLLHEGERVAIPPGGLSLGRAPESDIVLASELASRHHLRIGIAEGRHYVEDLGSLNGTYLNGERLIGEARWLSPGDAIVVGRETIRFLTGRETHAGLEATAVPGVQVVRFDGRRLAIGRDPANDLRLDAPSISRFHAEVVAADGELELRDLGSRTGTRLDGRPVARARVRAGSEVGVGPFRLVFDGASFVQRDDRGTLRLDAYDVSVTVAGKAILQPTSLSIQPGEFVAVIGESGSGKTTLLRTLAGVVRPTDGVVLVNGEPVEAMVAELGYLPQDEIVHPRLTVLESLRYSARLRLPPDATAAELEEAVVRVLGQTGLEEHARTRIGLLSGGQRKRVGLATELLAAPGLLFLDEPTSGLDPGLETRTMELFRRLAAVGGHALVVVTHATKNLALADRLCVMGRGGVAAFVGTPAQALGFFGVPSYDEIYEALDRRPAEEWRRDLDATPRPAPPVPPPPAAARERPRAAARARGLQARVLTSRYLRVFARDRRTVALLLLQAPFLALAAGLLFEPDIFAPPPAGAASPAAQLLFTLVIVMAWLGTISSAREIVKERPVFLRERAVGVGPAAYLASKLAVLAPLVALQAFLLALVAFSLRPLHASGGAYAAVLLVLALTGLAAVAMGLGISTLARTEEQGMALVPVALILQLLFGGAIVTVENMGGVVAALSTLIFSRWAFAGAGRIADMNDRLVADPVLGANNPYGLEFFDVPPPVTVLVLAAFAAAFLALTWVALRRRPD